MKAGDRLNECGLSCRPGTARAPVCWMATTPFDLGPVTSTINQRTQQGSYPPISGNFLLVKCGKKNK